MSLLMLQFIDPTAEEPLPVFRQPLGVAASLLQAEGFECSLAALGGYDARRLHEIVIHRRPRYILVDLTVGSATAARRTLTDLSERYQLPAAVCGRLATCRPNEAISLPGAEVLLLGEYDRSVVSLMRAWRQGAEVAALPGTWVRTPEGLVKGELEPLIEDLDALPYADRTLFYTHRSVQRTGRVEFRAARGCPYWCGWCDNDWRMDLYDGLGSYVRRRSVEDLMGEVLAVLRRYEGVREVEFADHAFALDAEWLREFAAQYPRRVLVPFRCHVPLQGLDEQIPGLLRSAGCEQLETRIPSGSRFIREEVFGVPGANEQITAACRAVREAGLRLTVRTFVGAPYESEITVEETLDLLRSCEPDEVRPELFRPTPGSRSAELCRENGWIAATDDASYWRNRAALDMPSMPRAEAEATVRRFDALLGRSATSGLRRVLGKVARRRPR